MSNLDRVLEDELRRQAARVRLPDGDLPGVLARGRRRRQHRMVAAVTTLAVVAATATGVALSRDNNNHQLRVDVAATNPVVHLGDAGIRWQRSDPHSALGYAYSTSTAGPLYAISTAPGVSQPNGPSSALYSSVDGVDWTAAAGPADLSLADIAATADRLYVVGTGSATASVASTKVGWSDDKARTWHQAALPIDVAAIAAKAATFNGEVIKIAAGPKGVVAVATISTVLDVPKLLPAGVSAPNGWALSDTGVDLLGTGPACPTGTTATRPESLVSKAGLAAAARAAAQKAAGGDPKVGSSPTQVASTPCFTTSGSLTMVSPQASRGITASYTWAQLGVSGDLLQSVLGEPFVFFSNDGTSYKRVALPVSNIRSSLVDVSTDASGFALLAQDASGGASVFHSSDGQQWRQDASLPADLSDVTAVGSLGGRTIVVGSVSSGSSAGTPAPGAAAVAILNAGHWTVSSLSTVLGSSVANAKVAIDAAGIGPLGVAVVVGDGPTSDVLFSPDGTTWSVQPLGQFVTGGIGQVTNVVVTANRAIVTLEVANPNQTGPVPEVVVVGTLA